jgi:hypothetical protein
MKKMSQEVIIKGWWGKPKIIAVMMELASILTINQLKKRKAVCTVKIMGLWPNYAKNSTPKS